MSLTDSLLFFDCREKFVHDYFGNILIESGEEPSFQVKPRINGTLRKTPKPVKSYPLEGANKQSDHNGIIIYYITGLGPEVIDMLVWRVLAIIQMQCQWLELWWIWN